MDYSFTTLNRLFPLSLRNFVIPFRCFVTPFYRFVTPFRCFMIPWFTDCLKRRFTKYYYEQLSSFAYTVNWS